MKKLILISGSLLFFANLMFGLILTAYPLFNVAVTTAVIIVTVALLYTLQVIAIKDAFVISFSFLFSFLGFVEFLLGCFAPHQIENNWYVLIVITLFIFEGILLMISKLMSNK